MNDQTKKQASLLNRLTNEKYQTYQDAYQEKTLEEIDLNYNLMFIFEQCMEWSSKLDPDKSTKQSEILNKMTSSAAKLLGHCTHIISMRQAVTVELLDLKSRYRKQASEIQELKETVNAQRKEIEYYDRQVNK